MKRIVIEGISSDNNTIIVDKYKLLFGLNINTKFYIRNCLRKYFDKDTKSEYEIEKSIKTNVLINDKYIDLKQYNYVEMFDLYDLKDDIKLGTKSLLLKYFDLYLDKIEYNDLFISTNNILKALESEVELNLDLESFNIIGEFIDLSKKSLLKMIELNVIKEELETSTYLLSYEEILNLQLELIKKIAKLDNTKEYIALVDIPVLSNNLLNKIKHEIDNLTILVFSYLTDNSENIETNNIAIVDKDIIDLYNHEQLYEISITINKNLSINELKEKLKQEHVLSINEVVKN